MNRDKINGWGAVFRFITPLLITISLFILGMLRSDLCELKAHFTNHLSEHKQIEVTLEKRLTHIETLLQLRDSQDNRR